MPDISILNVELHGKVIGTLALLPDDRTLFSFNNSYIEDQNRDTLSLSFKDIYGGLDTEVRPTRTQVPTFFANLLPEGHLREYLAKKAGVHIDRDFFLLWALGRDLPGAVRVIPEDEESWPEDDEEQKLSKDDHTGSALHFSLAGVQLKFSAVKDTTGGLTIPANGTGGSWIAKLPSTIHKDVPENEFAMMELARMVGIDVPETQLLPLNEIGGLPDDVSDIGTHAFVIKRFDRINSDIRLHIEDFAQVFGVYPQRKYERANYDMIAQVLSAETGEAGVVEFIRRFTFNALIGNGDMHLKNWSLIYPDRRTASIAPAYDFVSTILYIKNDKLALNFAGTKLFEELDMDRFEKFAAKARLSSAVVRNTVENTVERFHAAWQQRGDLPISAELETVINDHLRVIPLSKI
ncbi:type II toxin-antitoxin system HipA family toxin [Emcibacter nanhaiensis]|uniref:Type II toxin-antitoxin system HipA family toxin n=1 Tax=Emcibacter nanhaiensis TaxID=1505037 RepID=A0A501PGY9_9PROT|nr:HipA domain-containing protein [Emcibacter nanhaiensis]TPD59302.1 type II toxin-antitoxin system HipA family toxin [Emcibacter nanhaiensis]